MIVRTIKAVSFLCLLLALTAAFAAGYVVGPIHWACLAGAVLLGLLALYVREAATMLAMPRTPVQSPTPKE